MNNFGVIEIATTRTTSAPGWAYVPDRQQLQLPSAAAPSNRKRSRAAASGAANLSLADANVRQETKARREIEILDRDNARDVHIAIPVKNGIARTGGKKYTPNVRRILQSQKTFANHLDDYIALQVQQAETNPTGNAKANDTAGARTGQRQASASVGPSSSKKSGAKQSQSQQQQKQNKDSEDVEMIDPSDPQSGVQKSAILASYPPHPSHPEDANPLLASRLPPLPSDDELRALLAAPPLSYLEARGSWPSGDGEGGQQQRYPTRVFCAVCGYWGRVRCMKCGTRVCALECLETHREECITRYGL
ncbi:hypothetical protein F5B22DRAFT_306050 [Xylaria bambusicola]|uniref:uncharacterized protein n=1 Tax=Xylaria bambusicola TaxID=326684 RepID=UPI002007E3C6|nr:uncharacterized protein F5B22DRAFT_306050 [Xylaria bambusicola]KAI0512533.1 hypothetical protein F5B22DRAFT_306050 [Xylaria bambusicola]